MTRGRMLIADDDPTFLASTAELLRPEGYECETALDGMAAEQRTCTQSRVGEHNFVASMIQRPAAGLGQLRVRRWYSLTIRPWSKVGCVQ